MPDYGITAYLTESQLDYLNQMHHRIIVAKPTQQGVTVVWQVFKPFSECELTWEEEFGIYASTILPENGAVLSRRTKTPTVAQEGKLYTFQEDGAFGGPGEERRPGSYYAKNSWSEPEKYLTMGLYQSATINDELIEGNAVSAALVGHEEEATMTAHTVVYIWTEAATVSNTVVTHVSGPQLAVELSGEEPTAEVEYSSAAGGFVKKKGSKQEDGRFDLWTPTFF